MNLNKYFILFFLSLTINNSLVNSAMVKNRVLGSANWGTHITPLITAVANTDGPILEMGCGDFSTPILHAICAPTKRFLLSTESNKKWMNLFMDLKNDWHHFQFVPSIDKWADIGRDIHWGVVLVDHAPALQRIVDIKRLRNNTDIFVIHDTEANHVYKYEPYLSTFKYKYQYKRYKTATTLVSDIIDVGKFFAN